MIRNIRAKMHKICDLLNDRYSSLSCSELLVQFETDEIDKQYISFHYETQPEEDFTTLFEIYISNDKYKFKIQRLEEKNINIFGVYWLYIDLQKNNLCHNIHDNILKKFTAEELEYLYDIEIKCDVVIDKLTNSKIKRINLDTLSKSTQNLLAIWQKHELGDNLTMIFLDEQFNDYTNYITNNNINDLIADIYKHNLDSLIECSDKDIIVYGGVRAMINLQDIE